MAMTYEPPQPITARRLVQLLTQAIADDPSLGDRPVTIEGCDCTDEAIGISIIDEGGARLCVRRDVGVFEWRDPPALLTLATEPP